MGFLEKEAGSSEAEAIAKAFPQYMKDRIGKINGKLDEFFNEQNSEHYFKNVLERSGYQFHSEALLEGVIKPVKYLVDLGGKRVRSLLAMLVMECMGLNPNTYLEFAIIPEAIHNGTLIHDDVEDNSEYRRGAKALHKVYGLDIALNVGDALYYITMPALEVSRKLTTEAKHRIEAEYQKCMLGLSVGQATDLVWHNQLVDISRITEDEYLRVVFDKTGGVLGFAAKMAAIISDADQETVSLFGRLGTSIGVAFQIDDDILNIEGSKVAENKGGAGEDITEGKVTMLVIHALHTLPEEKSRRLVAILAMHSKDRAIIDEAIQLIQESGAIQYSKAKGELILEAAWSELSAKLPKSDAKLYMAALLDMLLKRES